MVALPLPKRTVISQKISRMSGHNKWSKIKRKKAVTDAAKSRVFSRHAACITMESKRARGDTTAPSLAAAIERAKKDSMPKDNIERAIAKGTGADTETYEEVLFETYGPGGTAILITAITDNNNRTSNEIRHILSKAGYQLGTPGSANWAFTKNENGYMPTNPIGLSDEDDIKLTELIEIIDEHDDIQDIFTSADNNENGSK